jgi:hypothetical protein
LNKIEARCNAAMPGPWRAVPRSSDGHVGYFLGAEIEPLEQPVRGQFAYMPDAEFIAAARTDVPRLVAEIRRLRAALAAPALALDGEALAAAVEDDCGALLDGAL